MSRVVQFDEGIWWIEVPLKGFEVRGALLVGRERALVWDTLSHPRDMAPLLPLVGDRELLVAYSHADWDHIWGTEGLSLKRASVIAQEAALERFAEEVPRELRSRQAAEPGMWEEVGIVPPTRTFGAELSLDLGGLSVCLQHLPGHTPDSAVAFVPEKGLLLAGDTAEIPFPCIPEDSPLPSWIDALRRWADDARVRTVVPSHGPVGGREILRSSIDYLQGIWNGTPVEPGEPLSDFYRETHGANLRFRRTRS